MKKIILLTLIIFVFIIGGYYMFKKDDLNTEKIKTLGLDKQTIDYYKEENTDRYISYKEKNPKLSIEDIITYVNIGIDQKYYTNTKPSKYLNTPYVLVNKYNYLNKNYIPNDLEEINNEYSIPGKKLVKEAKIAFEDLAQNAKKEGFTIRAMSTYRTYSYQKGLYDNYVKNYSKEEADTYSARPGFSEHQTGLSVDCDNSKDYFENFEKTKEFKWMKNNSYKYGFILRYPKGKEQITGYTYESWHYRYVGVDIATYIYKNDLTLEEYYVKFIDKKKTN